MNQPAPAPEPPPPAVVVAIEAQIRIRAEVDMVAYFTHLHGVDQRIYTELDVFNWGYMEEWERPLAFLMSASDSDGEISLLHGRGVLREVDDTDDIEARVRTRNGGETLYGSKAEWTEEDYNRLCEAVPWLAEHRHQVSGEPPADESLAWPHLSRVPAPDDPALIEEV